MEKEVLFLLGGLIGLWLGSGIAIDFGKKIAESLKISTLIIGLTVTSVGTSLGEIVTNVTAGYRRMQGIDTSGLAIGSIIGSNISLITFVLGFCGFFTVFLKIQEVQLREYPSYLDAAPQCHTGRRDEDLERVRQNRKERRKGDYDFRILSQKGKEGCRAS